ncbi:MAG: hypothetical protein ABI210_02540 [Abditibacteriaceae bacterium]
MTKRDILTLACRIIAFLILADTATKIFNSVLLILSSFFDVHQLPQMRAIGILELIGQVLTITACVFLWLKAERFAERFIPESTPESVLLIDETLVPSIMALAGMVIFILAISIVFNSSSIIFMSIQFENRDQGIQANSQLIAAVFQMAIGIGLFFGANGISQKLRHRIYSRAQA